MCPVAEWYKILPSLCFNAQFVMRWNPADEYLDLISFRIMHVFTRRERLPNVMHAIKKQKQITWVLNFLSIANKVDAFTHLDSNTKRY